jgi:glycosyltransferase involved in cell wall biosynthesis
VSRPDILVVPNMLNVKLWPCVPRSADLPVRVLFLGRLEQEKGVYDLLRALAEVRRDFPAVELFLAGEGHRDEVRRQACALGVDRSVHLLGWISGQAKQDAMARANIFVLPSYIENMPVSLLEAMASGLPVVATTVGGIPDVVEDGVNGFLVSPADIPALAGTLGRLVADSALRQRIGNAGRRRIEETFAMEKIVPRIEALYRELGAKERVSVTDASASALWAPPSGLSGDDR